MKFGVQAMGVSLRDMAEVARAYEVNGFESVWVPEHLVFPSVMPPLYPYSASGEPPIKADTPTYDPWVLLASLAAVTTTIRLATNVYILPLRHPLQTARSVVTLDRISGGRVTMGVGVGWLPEEFEYVGVPFGNRGSRTDATIDILRRLWSEDIIEVRSQHFSFGPLIFQPKPLQTSGIPIEIGGTSPPALRRAGSLGDGWIEIGSSDMGEFAEKLGIVMAARTQSGRDDFPFEVTVEGALAPDLEGYLRLRDAGATRILVRPPRDSSGRLRASQCINWAEDFRHDVIDRMGD